MKRIRLAFALLGLLAAGPLMSQAARAQPLDLSKGGPVTITSRDGIDWQQAEKVVIARGDARAVRDNVTVTADRLIAHYRPKAPPPGTNAPDAPPALPPAAKPDGTAPSPIDGESGGNEIYRLEADGNVRIFTPTDVATGDHATYDMDQAVLLLTGRNLKLTRPAEIITARDSLEYWSQLHRAVARGNAVVVTSDGRRLAGDTLVAYTTPSANETSPGETKPDQVPAKPGPTPDKSAADPLGAAGKIERVEGFGHVSVRTQTDTVTGDRGVYVPETSIARLGGNVRITRGENQLNGAEAEVDMKTGLSRLISASHDQVRGLVMPNDATAQAGAGQKAVPATAKDGKR